jgi:hypothetical protein
VSPDRDGAIAIAPQDGQSAESRRGVLGAPLGLSKQGFCPQLGGGVGGGGDSRLKDTLEMDRPRAVGWNWNRNPLYNPISGCIYHPPPFLPDQGSCYFPQSLLLSTEFVTSSSEGFRSLGSITRGKNQELLRVCVGLNETLPLNRPPTQFTLNNNQLRGRLAPTIDQTVTPWNRLSWSGVLLVFYGTWRAVWSLSTVCLISDPVALNTVVCWNRDPVTFISMQDRSSSHWQLYAGSGPCHSQ